MSALAIPNTPTRAQIDRLQATMVGMPQIELVTTHHFSPGMYLRKVWHPAGIVIVGKVHKAPHFFLCAAGEIIAWSEGGMKTLKAGDVIESQPGTKRVAMAVVDSIVVTIHRTDKTDVEDIETELIEPDEAAMFDALNHAKQGVLT